MAVKSVTCERLAELLTLVIGLAAENNPDILRTALGKVFDVTALEETNRRAVLLLSKTLDRVSESQLKASTLDSLVAKLEQRIEKAEAYLERLDKRLHPITNGKAK